MIPRTLTAMAEALYNDWYNNRPHEYKLLPREYHRRYLAQARLVQRWLKEARQGKKK